MIRRYKQEVYIFQQSKNVKDISGKVIYKVSYRQVFKRLTYISTKPN